ncbi:hypothetical protein [Liquorilactobacillus mali]|uniref:hypothetical protein n=1 Tax=Liquorilactobacillus mali TaxID=1618 RepID=UPI0002492E77|nr:hypothetical protein [Liquorilactobacillus mali]QFQ73656.1 hypothetical protein LM596_00170 [Liquorilactobacillus mali]
MTRKFWGRSLGGWICITISTVSIILAKLSILTNPLAVVLTSAGLIGVSIFYFVGKSKKHKKLFRFFDLSLFLKRLIDFDISFL